MLINDAIYLLDEAMKKLPEVRQAETDMQDDAVFVGGETPQERQERECDVSTDLRRHLRSNLTLAMVHVRMMGYTSREIAHPFLRFGDGGARGGHVELLFTLPRGPEGGDS